MTDLTPKLGQTTSNRTCLGHRDAFHVPCVLASSSDWKVLPGTSVRFLDEGCTQVTVADDSERHGVADPFVRDMRPGDLFWVFLVPELIEKFVHSFEIGSLPPVEARPSKSSFIGEEEGCYGTCG